MAQVVVCFILVCLTVTVSAVNFKRTVVALACPTVYGEYIFLQGGNRDGFPIPIIHNRTTSNTASVYAQTSRGDNFLNWDGVYEEEEQGNYLTEDDRMIKPAGTPMIWTTNDPSQMETVEENGHGFSYLNEQGEHLWMVDFLMDCDQTSSGWFDFKAYMMDLRPGYNNTGWESHFINEEFCIVDGGMWGTQQRFGWSPLNHHGRCGSFNFVMWSSDICYANTMAEYLLPYER